MRIKQILASLSVLTVAAAAGYQAMAANPQSVTANIRFDTPLTLTKVSDLDFKSVTAGVASTVYRLSTAGALSVVSGPGSAVFGTPVAGNISIVGSTTQTIQITAGNAAAQGGASVSNFKCNYDGGGEVNCSTLTAAAAPGAGKTLLLGADVTTGGSEAAGATAAPTYDITVVYN
ncbi:MAG: hypothetical protein EPN97_16200 [Alphaproteobacteria bacterium]|nr:MAG: hypothetical protein EPN97_16200 [Alphaproteobacteria bacterium]